MGILLLFAIATIAPVLLLITAAFEGGAWAWAAVGYITVLVFSFDRLMASQAENADPEAEFPAAQSLLITLGLLHFVILPLSVWAVGGPSGLGLVDRVLVAISASLIFGQISHPVAHELIHKSSRVLRLIGRLMYSSLLIGHHASAHLLVHHIHVGSDADPNSAKRGEGFYRYALRVARGSFIAGYRAETDRRKKVGKSLWSHPYCLYIGTAAGALVIALTSLGWGGFAAILAIAIYAQLQILLSDYVQHYGLRREVLANGRLEPVGPQHSWNAPQMFSAAMMLNAPRHSDHHVVPSRAYPALQLRADDMPFLPQPLPVMAVLALFPPIWRKLMDPLCDRWQSPSKNASQ